MLSALSGGVSACASGVAMMMAKANSGNDGNASSNVTVRPQRHVWIAIPAYTGTVHMATMRSVITDMLLLADQGHRVTIFDECGNGLIADARAVMVEKFLQSDGTDLVFVDSDVSWEKGALPQMLGKPVDLRVGVYPQRKDPIGYSVRWNADKTELRGNREHGLLDVWGTPAGFMIMSRTMLEKMRKHYSPELEFYCADIPGNKVCGLFADYWVKDHTLPDGRTFNIKFGEDFSFCQRWLDMGGEVWVDPELRMGHTGYKTFIGSLGDWLRANNGPPARLRDHDVKDVDAMIERYRSMRPSESPAIYGGPRGGMPVF